MTLARKKVLSLDAARRRVRSAQQRGERVVFTNGCFDWLHVGHVRSLEQARGLKLLDKDGDKIISKAELKWTDHNNHDPGTTLPE